MIRNTQTDDDSNKSSGYDCDDAPGAVYVLPGETEDIYVVEGKPVDEDRELAAGIVRDLREVIEAASSPSREIRCAMACHRGDRVHVNMVGEFPGLDHGFEQGTRFSEVLFASDDTGPSENTVEIEVPEELSGAA